MSIADPYTGEIKEVEVFVAVLGYSGKTYVELVRASVKKIFYHAL